MKRYIGRIKLSKDDSKEWSGSPPFMYVTADCDGAYRHNIEKAVLFADKRECEKKLSQHFKQYRHDEMKSEKEIMEVELVINNIKKIK